jgi:hypothetical protein
MEAFREVTVWTGIEYRQPNHVYLMEGDKIYAYIKFGEGKPEWFKSPLRIDRRGRKFERADKRLFGRVKAKSDLIEVQGSKGNVYHVDPTAKTCTCPGFTFRGSCKHITELLK